MFFGLFGKQPSTDWHQINLEWVLETMREYAKKIDNAIESIDSKIDNATIGTISGVESDVIFSGHIEHGQSVLLDGVDLMDYDLFIIEGCYENASYPFTAIGSYSPSGYYGAGLNALCAFYSTGGFHYQIALYVSDENGRFQSYVNRLNGSGDSFSTNVILNKITGYTFRDPNNVRGLYELV